MTHSTGRGAPRLRGLCALAMTALLIAGCGSKQEVAAGNDVEMRDMEVVDGTANDAMTDLDAVQADGVGTGGNVANASARAPAPAAAPEPGGEDSEAVASE